MTQMICEIESNERLSGDIFDMRVVSDALASAKPGQIAHFLCGAKTLRRPLSVADAADGKARFLYEVRGEGTRYLSALHAGDTVDVLGPVGQGFTVTEGRALLVGGGIGVFPLLSLARAYGDRSAALLGFRSADAVVCDGDFERFCDSVAVITDDGSSGRRGYVSELLEEALTYVGGFVDIIHVCGPRAMMASCATVAERFGVRCEVSMEERMACGVGACLGCAVKMKGKSGVETYRRACADGPVFDAADIDWS